MSDQDLLIDMICEGFDGTLACASFKRTGPWIPMQPHTDMEEFRVAAPRDLLVFYPNGATTRWVPPTLPRTLMERLKWLLKGYI